MLSTMQRLPCQGLVQVDVTNQSDFFVKAVLEVISPVCSFRDVDLNIYELPGTYKLDLIGTILQFSSITFNTDLHLVMAKLF